MPLLADFPIELPISISSDCNNEEDEVFAVLLGSVDQEGVTIKGAMALVTIVNNPVQFNGEYIHM